MSASIQEMTDEQLVHQVLQAERSLVDSRFRHSMGQLEDTTSLRGHRRSIARMLTEARTREAAQGLTKNALVEMHKTTFNPEVVPTPVPPTGGEEGGFLSGVVDKLAESE
jgi:ribosomal protein L29